MGSYVRGSGSPKSVNEGKCFEHRKYKRTIELKVNYP